MDAFYIWLKAVLAVVEDGLQMHCWRKQKRVKEYHRDVKASGNEGSQKPDNKTSCKRDPLVIQTRNNGACSQPGKFLYKMLSKFRKNKRITEMCDKRLIKQAIESIRSLERFDDDKLQHDDEELGRRLDILSAFFRSFTGLSSNVVVDRLQKLKLPLIGFQVAACQEKVFTLRRRLIQFYQGSYSRVGREGPLEDFYVSSILNAAEMTNKIKESAEINSFKELIYGKSKSPCKHVYITGSAGMGKSAFVQQLTITWCHAHTEEKRLDISNDDAETLRSFDLLFYLNLRDFRNTGSCDLENMISSLISKISPDYQNSSDQIAKAFLRDQFCLVILDGLDEWTHSKSCQKNSKGLPHQNGTSKCTILTTSRKPSTPFDKAVQLHGLSSRGSKRLKQYLLKQLNPDIAKITLKEFENFLFDMRLVGALNRPYHCLNLFEFWKSKVSRHIPKSEVYDFIIQSAVDSRLRKHNDSNCLNASQRFLSCSMPNATLQIQLKLGKMHFFALVWPEKNCDGTLLSSSEIDNAFESGILKQTNELATEWPFCETAVREFLSAKYVSLCWSKEEEKQTILQAIFSVPEDSGVVTSFLNILRSVNENSHEEICHIIASKKNTTNKREGIRCKSAADLICTSDGFSSPVNMGLELLDRDQCSVDSVEPVSDHNHQEQQYGQENDREMEQQKYLKGELEKLQKDLKKKIEELKQMMLSREKLLNDIKLSHSDKIRSEMSLVRGRNKPSQQYKQTVSSTKTVDSNSCSLAKSSLKNNRCTVLPRTFGKDIQEDGFAHFSNTLLDQVSIDETPVKTLPSPNICEAGTMETLKSPDSKSGPDGENNLEVSEVIGLHDQNAGSHVLFSSGYPACTFSETAVGSTIYDLSEKPFQNENSVKSTDLEDQETDESEVNNIKVGEIVANNENKKVLVHSNNYNSTEEREIESPEDKNEPLDCKQDDKSLVLTCLNEESRQQAVSTIRAELDKSKEAIQLESKGRDKNDTEHGEGNAKSKTVINTLLKEFKMEKDKTGAEDVCLEEDERSEHNTETDKPSVDDNVSSTDIQEIGIIESMRCETSGTECVLAVEKTEIKMKGQENCSMFKELRTKYFCRAKTESKLKKLKNRVTCKAEGKVTIPRNKEVMSGKIKTQMVFQIFTVTLPREEVYFCAAALKHTQTWNAFRMLREGKDRTSHKEESMESTQCLATGYRVPVSDKQSSEDSSSETQDKKTVKPNNSIDILPEIRILFSARSSIQTNKDIIQHEMVGSARNLKIETRLYLEEIVKEHPRDKEKQNLESVQKTKTENWKNKKIPVRRKKKTLGKRSLRKLKRESGAKEPHKDKAENVDAENISEEPKRKRKRKRRRRKSESDISKMKNYPKGELSEINNQLFSISIVPLESSCYIGHVAGSSSVTSRTESFKCSAKSNCFGEKLVSHEISLEFDSGYGSSYICFADTNQIQPDVPSLKSVVLHNFPNKGLSEQKFKYDGSEIDLKPFRLSVGRFGNYVKKFFEKQNQRKIKGIVRQLHVEHIDFIRGQSVEHHVHVFGLISYFNQLNRGEVPSLLERMRYEWLRLASFQHYQGAGSAVALARNGFFHDPAGGPTSTRCYLCEAAYSDWQLFQNVEERHRQLSPNCPFHTNRHQVSVNHAITYESVPLSSRSLESARVGGASYQSSAATSGLGTSISSAAASSTASGFSTLSASSAAGNSVKEVERILAEGQATTDSISRLNEVIAQQPEENDENRDRSLLALPNTRAFRVLGRSGEDAYAHLTTPPRRNNVAVGAGTNVGLDPLQASVATSIPTSIVSSTTSTTIHNSIFGYPIGAGAFGRNAASTQITTSTTTTTSTASTLTPQSSVVSTVQTSTAPTSTVAGASSILRPSDPPIGGGGRTDPTITVVVDNPKHPDYRNIDDRVNSFQGWPEYLDQTPRQMSEAGFFFVGVADFTRCFCCGGGLRNWEPGDDPMLEHTRWFPRCEYVNKLKGERYVAAVQRRHQEHMEQQQREQVEAAQRRDANRNPPDPMSTETAAVLREMGYQPERIREAILTVRQRTGSSDVTTQQVLTYLLDENEDRRPPPTTARQSPTDLGVKINELNLPSTTTAIETMPTTTVVNTTTSVSTESSIVSAGTNFTSAVSSPQATRAEIQKTASTTSASSEARNSQTGSSSKEGKGNDQTGSGGKEVKGSSSTEKQSAASGGESDGEYQSAEESLTTEAKSAKKKTKKKGKTKLGSKSGATGGSNVDTRTLKEENEKLREMQTCKICMERPVNTTLLPCGHLVCCDICASRLNRCPICRKRIKGTVKTFMS